MTEITVIVGPRWTRTTYLRGNPACAVGRQKSLRPDQINFCPPTAPPDPSGAMTSSAIGRLKAIDSFGLRLPSPPHSECPPDSRLAVARQHRQSDHKLD
jgi:hypothetical protein